MRFFTPERKENHEWALKNENILLAQFDGKHILIHNCEVIDFGLSEEELAEKAKKRGLEEGTYNIMVVGSAIASEIVDSGIWW